MTAGLLQSGGNLQGNLGPGCGSGGTPAVVRPVGEETNSKASVLGHRPQPARPSARRLLSRLDARPLAARAAADVSALVRRAGATLRLRPKERA
ncbi:PREDICTED: PDZ domain-containing protein MAGIX-like isoform X2 [Chinchilla lanigera]|uniref:PDZ domain-containing protein MAGIX-like isoform X2 n=1 Tax=Chinchilla lanigera TaxID=34839 RepID=UPI000697D0E4|nr:PREDICTED: PDZ domain-containing protein MAGIX-like isoform X2 [Chinchilla lanigera]